MRRRAAPPRGPGHRRLGEEGADGIGQGGRVPGRHDHAGVADDAPRVADISGNGGQADGHAFRQGVGKSLAEGGCRGNQIGGAQ